MSVPSRTRQRSLTHDSLPVRSILVALTVAFVACAPAGESAREPELTPSAAPEALPKSGWSGDSTNPVVPVSPPQLVTQPPARLDPPAVTVASAPFPVIRSLALRSRAATEEDRAAVRLGIER